MKLLKLNTIAVLTLMLFSNNNASALVCSKEITSNETAKECAEEFLGKKEDMWNFVSGKNHTGDMSICTTTMGTSSTKSYFTNNKSNFESGLGTAAVKTNGCNKHGTDPDAYICYIETGPNSCFLQSGQNGIASTSSMITIGISSKKLITFFPTRF